MNKLSIAIDGPAAAGKTTITKMIAKAFNLETFNTGLIYRGFAAWLLNDNFDIYNEKKVNKKLKNIKLDFKPSEIPILNPNPIINNKTIWMGMTSIIKNVTKGASVISTYKKARKVARKFLKKYRKKPRVILEGRDIATRILPKADIKIYLDAKLETRAERRFFHKQYHSVIKTNYDTVLKEIKERDERDLNRKIDPLKIAKDAIYIDTTDLSIKETFLKIKKIILEKYE